MPTVYDQSGLMAADGTLNLMQGMGSQWRNFAEDKRQFEAQLQQRQAEVAQAHVMDMVRMATDNARYNRAMQMDQQRMAQEQQRYDQQQAQGAEQEQYSRGQDKKNFRLKKQQENRYGQAQAQEAQSAGAMQSALGGMMAPQQPQGAPSQPAQSQQPAQVASFGQPMPGQSGSPMQAQGQPQQPMTPTFQPTNWQQRLLPAEAALLAASQQPNSRENQQLQFAANEVATRAQMEARDIDQKKLQLHTRFLTLQQQGVGDQMLAQEVQAAMQTGDPALIDGALQKIDATQALFEQSMRREQDNEIAVQVYGQLRQELAPAPDSPGMQTWERKGVEWDSLMMASMGEQVDADTRLKIQNEVTRDMQKTASEIAASRGTQARYDIRATAIKSELASVDAQLKEIAKYAGLPGYDEPIAQLTQQRAALVQQQSAYAALQPYMRPGDAPQEIQEWDARGNNYRSALQEIALKLSGGDPNMVAEKYQEVIDLTGWKDTQPAINPRQDYGGAGRSAQVARTPTLTPNSQGPLYAVNPQTGERILSTDGGQTWQPAPR